DEVVHGKGSLLRKAPGDDWQQAASLRAYLTFQWTYPGKQLLFMGTEFAQGTEWSEQSGLPWWLLEYPLHRGAQQLVTDLNAVQAEFAPLYQRDQDPGGFEWLIGDDAAHNTIAFVRRDEADDPVVVVLNFSAQPWTEYRVPLPEGGTWLEVLNTDSPVYGGSGVGNLGMVHAEPVPMHGRDHSVRVAAPPLGGVILVPERLRESRRQRRGPCPAATMATGPGRREEVPGPSSVRVGGGVSTAGWPDACGRPAPAGLRRRRPRTAPAGVRGPHPWSPHPHRSAARGDDR